MKKLTNKRIHEIHVSNEVYLQEEIDDLWKMIKAYEQAFELLGVKIEKVPFAVREKRE